MTDAAGAAPPRQSLCFLLLYALAWAGGAVAYTPLLTLLLPVRMTALFGADDVHWLGIEAFCGAVAASAGSIVFGWLSDRSGTRRPWIAAGLAVTIAMYAVIARMTDPVALIAAICVWQLGLNMMLGPLGAWAGDCVPDAQKGLLGGLLACAPATGALAGTIVTIPGLAGPDMRLTLVAVMVAAAVLPVLIFGAPRPIAALAPDPGVAAPRARAPPERAIVGMWAARLAVQIAEAALFAYLFFYFRSLDASFRDADTARIFSVVLVGAVPAALLVGRWADAHRNPLQPLMFCAALSAGGLAVMALSGSLAVAMAGYILFGLATAVFLALHSGQTLRVLPRPDRRGRDLGFFNLTNTIPSMVMPWLTLGIVPGFGYAALLWVLAALALSACLLLASLRRLP